MAFRESRGLTLLAIAALAALSCAAVVGCGGGKEKAGGEEQVGAEEHPGEEASGEEEGDGSEAEREAAEAAEASKEVPEEDRIAYYQLGITSGLLRAALVAASMGQPSPPRAGPEQIRRFALTVRRVQPSDRGLERVRTAELAMLVRVHPPASVDRAEARRELRKLDRINAALSRFLKREPAQAALVPD